VTHPPCSSPWGISSRSSAVRCLVKKKPCNGGAPADLAQAHKNGARGSAALVLVGPSEGVRDPGSLPS
jgi:hypothetical protein